MSKLATRAGYDAFRTRMCDEFAQLPSNLGNLPLHVEQADLDPNTFFTHRLDGSGHHITYDPRQTNALSVRQFLGIFAEFSEDPVTDRVRNAYYDAEFDEARQIWAIALGEIDRNHDPRGTVGEIIRLLESRRPASRKPTVEQSRGGAR